MQDPHGNVAAAKAWLESWGISRIVSKDTQQVATADYSGRILPLSLAQFEQRIPPRDPRRDAWTNSLGSWFAGSIDGTPREVWYIRESLPARLAPRSFSAGLSAHGLVEIEGRKDGEEGTSGTWVGILLALLGASPLFITAKNRRFASVGLGLPWLAYCVMVPEWHGAFAVAAMAVIPFSTQFLEGLSLHEAKGRRITALRAVAAILPPLFLPFFAACLFRPAAFSSFLLLDVSSALALLAVLVSPLRSRGRGFVAVRIVKRLVPALRLPSFPLLFLCTSIALAALVPVLLLPFTGVQGEASGAHSVEIPMPSRAFDTKSPTQISLPGLDVWRLHMKNEASFFNRALRISSSQVGGDSLAGRGKGAYGPPTSGIERVLFDQGPDATFAMAKLSAEQASRLALWRFILYIILPLVVFAVIGTKTITSRRLSGHHL